MAYKIERNPDPVRKKPEFEDSTHSKTKLEKRACAWRIDDPHSDRVVFLSYTDAGRLNEKRVLIKARKQNGNFLTLKELDEDASVKEAEKELQDAAIEFFKPIGDMADKTGAGEDAVQGSSDTRSPGEPPKQPEDEIRKFAEVFNHD